MCMHVCVLCVCVRVCVCMCACVCVRVCIEASILSVVRSPYLDLCVFAHTQMYMYIHVL